MNSRLFGIVGLLVAGFCLALAPSLAIAQTGQPLNLCSSAQVAEILVNTGIIDDFTKATGIGVDLEVTTSEAAVGRLAANLCNLALTAQRLDLRYQSQGFIEHPFLKDALAIIGNVKTTVDDLSPQQIRGLFSGVIKNWKEVGGADLPVVVVIPAKETALYRNFSRMVMEGEDVAWDIMTARSTNVHEVARRFNGVISFVNYGTTQGKPEGARVLKVNGLSTSDPKYPYFQVFSFVTKGQPDGAIKKFVDFMGNSDNTKKFSEFGVHLYQK